MKEKAPIDVIIPCYRCTKTVERAINSVLFQTLLPSNIFLVDDGSGDGTLDLLRNIKAQYSQANIEIIPLAKNCGPSVARNIAWDVSANPYIAFLDADDAWHRCKIEIQYKWMVAHPSVSLTGHHCIWVRNHQDITQNGLIKCYKARRIKSYNLLVNNYFATRSVMLRRDLAYRFEPTQRHCEDYLLWLQIVLSGREAYLIELPLAYLFKAPYGHTGLAGDLHAMEKGELLTYKRLKDDGIISISQYLFCTFFSLMKYFRRLVINKFHGK